MEGADIGDARAQRAFVINEDQLHELEEIDERLKTYDPARQKRRDKQ